MKKSLIVLLFVIFAQAVPSLAIESAFAFQGAGCGQDCASCHTLSKDEAKKLIKADAFKAEVNDVKISPVKGLWEIQGTTKEGKRFIVYVDFGKKYLVEGNFTPLEQLGKPPELRKLDLSKIPLTGTVIMGNPMASKKIIVFDDPDCPYCKKLHEEIKKILKTRKDIAFYIKLYPLDIHPKAYEKSKAILCKKSVNLLDDAFAGKELPQPDCNTKEVDDNINLGRNLGINGTPAIIFSDGRLLPGYVDSQTLIKMLETPQ
ncbi:MAG: DsbC family protein [Deltaproteobacteria bacterium]|nr:DsbC family protein [Deltaproteobacteria bacterium]